MSARAESMLVRDTRALLMALFYFALGYVCAKGGCH